ncbi:hypothetical protein EMIHUDRAFT_201680 [Emiliania huxleyi CCMP1516]|uniref:Uncharacterized protein n=2 Tax=Emiliania huxleyi TaxID=2903 RepID=A0A0D3KIE8_EMIH1|nr:hypothetical protein EMIHUDRAFT_201680 [Emiliania huxleyi CCMP1516]EOD35533.1 hypothetical protein EMIHUDRAFT_201680 [Emiliania huxleyi CCMP1516]|eukprot:XP_005787962.1 hypothetical protein EMIHUDRAFT_201680 [Emiliania huxleyi CCMP1516]
MSAGTVEVGRGQAEKEQGQLLTQSTNSASCTITVTDLSAINVAVAAACVWGATGAAYTSASISGTWGLYEDLTPDLSELASYWSIGDEYTVSMTATSTCSSSQNLGFEGGGVGYFQVTVPANAVNVRVSATDTVSVTGTVNAGFQSRSTNSASCTITVTDLSAINVAVAAACVWGATGAAYTSASISGTWGLYEDLTPDLSELASYWSIGDEYTVSMTATSTCSSSQNLGFEGGGVGYFQVTVPANAVNVRVSATDTVSVTGTVNAGFQSRSTNSASCTITVTDMSAINVAVAAACVWGATVGAAYTSASISGTWGLYDDLTPDLSELASYWSIGDEYTVSMTATSTCSSSQNLGFEGGGVGYFQVTVPANAVNVRVSATDTVSVTGTVNAGFQSRSTNSASCTITVTDLSAINVAVAAACVWGATGAAYTSASISGTWGLYEDLTPDLSELASYWSIGDEYTVSMTATSTCSSSQNLGFEGGGVGYFQVTVPANAVNVRVSATDTVSVTGTVNAGFQSRSTNSASCTITVTDLSAINVAVAAACVSPPPSASVRQDPHLHFAHGGQADFRGRNGVYYAFYSGPYLAVNVKTQDASFWLHGGKLLVHGSFLTEVHVVARSTSSTALALASFWAEELNPENWGWNVVNGTCKRHYFKIGKWGRKQCDRLSVEMTFSTATFTLGNWTVTARGNHVYNWISGPKHRIDVSFSARGDAPVRSLAHGIIGQSFASAEPRYGLRDEYPKAGEFTTSAMAEGAIEGEAAIYPFEGAPNGGHFFALDL